MCFELNQRVIASSFSYVTLLRNFVEAVIDYTQANKVSIISHSMGVTLGRKVVQGGSVSIDAMP